MQSRPKILITRLKSIGDVLFTLPAVNCVRQNFPNAHISFLVQSNCAPLLEGFPAVNQVLVLDRGVYRQKNVFRMASSTWHLLKRLRAERFTHAIDLHGFGETALLTRWTGASERWGVVYKWGRKFAYTKKVTRRDDLHPIDGNLEVLRQVGLATDLVENRFVLKDEYLREAGLLLEKLGIRADEKFLFLQPFTSNLRKDWPLEKFLHLADHWQGRGLRVLFGGGPADRERLGPVLQKGYPTSAGAPLMVSAALAARSELVVGGDTGLMHMAVALQRPVVMLLKSAAIRTTPYAHPEWAITPAPGEELSSVSWESVAQQIEQTLSMRRSTGQAVSPG